MSAATMPAPTAQLVEAPPELNRHERMSWYIEQRRLRSLSIPDFRASLQMWSDAHPMKPCIEPRCKYGSHELHDEHGRLVSVVGCPACRGLGRVFMSIDEMRDEYRAIRARVCSKRSIAPSEFDALVLFTARVGRSSTEMAGECYAAAKNLENER